MTDKGFILTKRADMMLAYEERAERERVAAVQANSPELASAHRLLAIQYEADAEELRRQVATST